MNGARQLCTACNHRSAADAKVCEDCGAPFVTTRAKHVEQSTSVQRPRCATPGCGNVAAIGGLCNCCANDVVDKRIRAEARDRGLDQQPNETREQWQDRLAEYRREKIRGIGRRSFDNDHWDRWAQDIIDRVARKEPVSAIAHQRAKEWQQKRGAQRKVAEQIEQQSTVKAAGQAAPKETRSGDDEADSGNRPASPSGDALCDARHISAPVPAAPFTDANDDAEMAAELKSLQESVDTFNQQPRMLTEDERELAREDLRTTVEIARNTPVEETVASSENVEQHSPNESVNVTHTPPRQQQPTYEPF